MIFLGVGSNLGDRWMAISQAWQELEKADVQVECSSPIYETLPWGYAKQPPYLNAVWRVRTTLSPLDLLRVLKAVERRLGRLEQKPHRWGARLIDLDLLAYGTYIVKTDELTLPHPWIPQRAFVLGPWRDIAPDFYLVAWQATVEELGRRCCGGFWGYPVNPPQGLPLPPIVSPLPIQPPAGVVS